jgi:Na+/phosphate symporter
MLEDEKIIKHNKKLQRLGMSIDKATNRVTKYSHALADPRLSNSTSERHTKSLEAAMKACTKAQNDIAKVVEAGLELIDTGSGKVVLDLPEK